MQVVVQAPAPTPPTPPDVLVIGQPPWETMPPQAIVIIAVAGIVMAGLVLWPLMRALARRIDERLQDENLPPP